MAVCSLPVLAFLLVWVRRLLPGGEDLEQALTQALLAEGPADLLLVLFVGALTPAVCEEILFRGWILSALGRSCRPATALGLQALLFGLLHLHPLRFVPTLLLGLLLGWLALRARSILAPILAHAAFNGAIVLLVQVGDTGGEVIPPPSGLEALQPALWALALLLAGCALFQRLTRPGSGPEAVD